DGAASIAMTRGPTAVAFKPLFAYVANINSNSVSAYAINAVTGALTSLGSAIAAGSKPYSVAVNPSADFAYVANINSNSVSAYAINSATGTLTVVTGSPFAAGTNPFSVTIDPSGRFAYVANNASNNISTYTIDASSGALTPLSSPVAAGT